jgi:hypothetical protein
MLNETTGAMNDAQMGTDNSNVYLNGNPEATFDNLEDFSEQDHKQAVDEDAKKTSDKKKEKDENLSEELKLLNDSDGEEVKEKKEDKKEEKKEEEDDKEEIKEEVKEGEDKKGKKLKVKVGDELFGLEPDATIKVKVDGKNQEVTVQELINNYSGKVAYDTKFNEIGTQKKEVEQKFKQLEQTKSVIKSQIEPIIEIIKDGTRDPYEAVMHIVDMVGGDPYTIFRRSLESRLGELENLLDMSEVERKNYFLEKQNEFLLKSTEKRTKSYESEQKLNQYAAQVDQIRQAYGVSEDQFVNALDELVELGFKESDIKDEFIAEWAAIKPYKSEVEELLQPYLDEIDDAEYGNIVSTLSRNLMAKKVTKDQVAKYLQEAYEVPSELKSLNQKIQKPGPKPASHLSESQGSIETFDDLLD